MADYSPSQNTKGAAVLTPPKEPFRSIVDFFGGKTLRLNKYIIKSIKSADLT